MGSISKYGPSPKPSFSYLHHETKYRPWENDQRKILDFDLDLPIDTDWFRNNQGCIRWNFIRQGYFSNLIDQSHVLDLYKEWRNDPEYLWLDGYNVLGEFVQSLMVKASKRGNDIYKDRLKKKFSILDQLPPIHFFTDWGVKSTPMIFVTLTVDPKRFDLDQSWDQISMELHLFETKLRQKYGSFVKFRVWESHESGYPHAHIIYYFHDYTFHVFDHINKHDQKRTFRISNKHRDTISSYWSMGHIDIQGVQDTLGAFSEVKKYITKTIWSKKGDLTNAMLCLHRKQSYWISLNDPYDQDLMIDPSHQDLIKQGVRFFKRDKDNNEIPLSELIRKDFIGSVWGVDTYLDIYLKRINLAEPNNADLVLEAVHNCNIDFPEIVEFRFLGVVRGMDLKKFVPKIKLDPSFWIDPPPELKYLLGLCTDDIRPISKHMESDRYCMEYNGGDPDDIY